MSKDPAQYHRMIANLIKQGNIVQTDPTQGLVRVQCGEMTSDWLPYFVPAAGGVSVHRPPSVGENCIILSPSGETAWCCAAWHRPSTRSLPTPPTKPC